MLLLCLDIQVLLSSKKALIRLVISAKAGIRLVPRFPAINNGEKYPWLIQQSADIRFDDTNRIGCVLSVRQRTYGERLRSTGGCTVTRTTSRTAQ
jgi:hypothetical protein